MPELLPMLKPFRQAVTYQLGRVPGLKSDFENVADEAGRRGFWIAGLTRRALAEEALGAATAAVRDGLTRQEFLDRLAATLDQKGGTLLDPRRLELIARNNVAVSYAAGRWAQMNDPEVLAERPYRQYPLGPHDPRTSPICLKLEGLVWRAGDPIERHIIPANHHDERHLQVLTLTQEQAEASGTLYASVGDMEYPVIDGETILPDPGWDNEPGMLAADERALAAAAREAGAEVPAKTAADYRLAALADVDATTLPALPATADAITDVAELAQYDEAWTAFQEAVGIAEGKTMTVVVDAYGDGVIVTRGSYDALVGLAGDDAARAARQDVPSWFGALMPALADPLETWMVTRASASGAISLSWRFFGAFVDGEKTLFTHVDLSPDGWLMDAGFSHDAAPIDAMRRGRLIQTKVRRTKQ